VVGSSALIALGFVSCATRDIEHGPPRA
jgi:hypothetical protein